MKVIITWSLLIPPDFQSFPLCRRTGLCPTRTANVKEKDNPLSAEPVFFLGHLMALCRAAVSSARMSDILSLLRPFVRTR